MAVIFFVSSLEQRPLPPGVSDKPAHAFGYLGFGTGDVTAITWEYGNTFTIVAGLLNMLVVLDAFDITQGRK